MEDSLNCYGTSFFSLSLGMGALMVYGSYLSSDISIPQTCVIVATLDTIVALLAGLAIFPIVISSGLEMTQGPGLIFQTLTVAFAAMPGGQLLELYFYIINLCCLDVLNIFNRANDNLAYRKIQYNKN